MVIRRRRFGGLPRRSVRRGRARLRQERSAWGFSRSSSGLDAFGPGCRTGRQNTHGIEEREVAYPWHPWAGRIVCIHEVTRKVGAEIFRYSLSDDPSVRCLELPGWMFDRTVCAPLRLAEAPVAAM